MKALKALKDMLHTDGDPIRYLDCRKMAREAITEEKDIAPPGVLEALRGIMGSEGSPLNLMEAQGLGLFAIARHEAKKAGIVTNQGTLSKPEILAVLLNSRPEHSRPSWYLKGLLRPV